ncbi:MAG TPA: GspE/PulE family protein [Verrucomicrobiae bacterium]|nr:GspE/PulE family protein [Verrucomicrobiae bacterium]
MGKVTVMVVGHTVRSLILTVLNCLFLAGGLGATEVKLKDGPVYHDTKILERDDFSIRITVPHGEVKLPLALIESIDGIPVEAPPIVTSSRADNIQSAVAALPSPYVHRWRMDLFIAIIGLLSVAWIGTMVWVQGDIKGMPETVRRVNARVLLLPIGGFAMYLVQRRRRLRNGQPSTLGGRVAGLKAEEVPKKRGLFGGRTKIAATLAARKRRVEIEFLDVNNDPIQIRQDMPEMTGIEAAREVLEEAVSERASDIHLEPQNDGCRVRFRVDGTLQERLTFTRTDGLRVVAALKALAQIDVAEKRKAQDGRFRVRTGNGDVDFRAATTNAIHGEKMVLRILDRKSGVMSLEQLGMDHKMMEHFERVIHSRNGIILATGPTGSGKTSTLYAALSRLDKKKLNIMSIEDPVEYELEGATQIPVNVKAGVSYEAGLRSIMRQDPDVIFVGEMRDTEAARITVRAALTGHLVFSSLHAKHCVGTIVRLVDIGVERYQIASALLMVVAQRLVRVLCKKCREPYSATGQELEEVGLALKPGSQLYRAIGCEACDQSGYQGRTGIFELLVMDEALRKAVTDGVDEQTLFIMASERGLRSYYDDGAEKVLKGITTVEDVIQAI